MSASGKFDYSPSGPDRPLYSSTPRGSNSASQMERSSSFRESTDNPALASHLNTYRNNTATTQGDVVTFFQCLRFDPKVVAADHKSARQNDFKRHVNIALGVSGDESPAGLKGKLVASPIPEEIKRVRACLRENSVKARERAKIFNESLSVFNKFFPSVPTKKRSRSETFANDRSIMGSGLGKAAIQGQAMASFELEQQKSEERTKIIVPNKRTRTSLMDARGNSIGRLPMGDRDKETLKLANSITAQGECRALSVTVDSWEKPKMRKKRSGIKADISPSMGSSKTVDGYRETKQGAQQRPSSDMRSRLNSDSQGLRQGIVNGASGSGKSDVFQPTGLMVRTSISRADMEHGSPYSEKRERPTGSEKERMNLRASNKPNFLEEFSSSSPTSNPKMNASVRGPRSGSGLPPKLSPVVQNTANPSDLEISGCTYKPLAAVSNRKRTAMNRSSSPPQWVGQRPQKISRVARRTSLIPIVSNNDENPSEDTVSDVTCNETGFGFSKRSSDGSSPQLKLKVDNASLAALSESEESGALEIRPKEKARRSDELDDKAIHNVQKIAPTVLSSRKSKLVSGDDIVDGIRRQGRTGRGSASTRSLIPVGVEKLGNVGTAKQLRSGRYGFDKSERTGRPPTRKLSDRKAYKRHKNAVANAPVDFLVGSDDGREELLAAVKAVINSVRLFPSPFWRLVDPFFRLISDADLAFLKQECDMENATPATVTPSNLDGSYSIPNGYGSGACENDFGFGGHVRGHECLSDELISDRGDCGTIPLYKRFLAALISEEDCSSVDEEQLDGYGNVELEAEAESDGLIQMVKFGSPCESTLNGCMMMGKIKNDVSGEDVSVTLLKDINTNHCLNGVFSDQTSLPAVELSGLHYDDLGSERRIYLEAQSIGIALEQVPAISHVEDGGLASDICELEERHRDQVSKKKGMIDKLLRCAAEMKEHQEKEFEQQALDKLVSMAYEKYTLSRRHHASVGKSSKMARQVALMLVKRTLERCHQCESTGKSCFNEPYFKDAFSSGLAQLAENSTDGVPAYTSISSALEAKVSASMGLHRSPIASQWGYTGDGFANSSDSLTPMHSLNEQNPGGEDTWSDRIKKKELFLDDVGGPSSIGNSLSSSTKGKRSERDREGKGQFRESSSRNATNKIGRPAAGNAKGERKPKAKPKQKTTQLSASLNGPFGKIGEPPKASLAKSGESGANSDAKETNGFGLDAFDDSALDLSHLQIPDGLGGPDDLDGHAQDLSTWLNIDEDALQDNDLMGLQIPMDDLSDLNMMV